MILAIFPDNSRPMQNLESQAKNTVVVLPGVSQSKFEANRSRGSRVIIKHLNKKKITSLYKYIDSYMWHPEVKTFLWRILLILIDWSRYPMWALLNLKIIVLSLNQSYLSKWHDHCTGYRKGINLIRRSTLYHKLWSQDSWARNLKQIIVIKPSIGNPVSWMGSFVETNTLLRNIISCGFFTFSFYILISLIKIFANVETPNEKLGSFAQPYCLESPRNV